MLTAPGNRIQDYWRRSGGLLAVEEGPECWEPRPPQKAQTGQVAEAVRYLALRDERWESLGQA